MSTDENDSSASPTNRRRRSSFVNIFANRTSDDSCYNNNSGHNTTSHKATGSAMASAMAQQAQQSRTRRLSITSLGLSGSPTHVQQTSPFGTLRDRGQSLVDAGKRPFEAEESAVDEDVDTVSSIGSRPNSPTVTRSVSFGTKTHKDQRSTSGASSNAASSSEQHGGSNVKTTTNKSPPSPSARKDGFNWSDNLRSRAERTSISTASLSSGGAFVPPPGAHARSKSLANPDAPSATPETPAAPKTASTTAPDHFQERILKGDFYMD
ncbi:MAG: hypothetical protein M1828_006743 [Chrysothrix sp. TS-e1954]|nr:MAG: hypothetical protein M1828_006743 [Chrysothrix sp. TS-e1954]